MATFWTKFWTWISGILGVTCLLLIATLGIMLEKSFYKPSIKPTIFSGINNKFQKDSDCCSCQEKWIGYQCNCYLISSDLKSWEESRDFCASQNSTLLLMHYKDELQPFMRLNAYFYWIGATYSKEHHAWTWEDGSAVSEDLLLLPQTASPMKCITYSPALGVLDELCRKKNLYICKQQLI